MYLTVINIKQMDCPKGLLMSIFRAPALKIEVPA
jgi:hypothetical protein